MNPPDEDADFSDEFCQFLQGAIPAVETAELLLLLKRDPARPWALEELSRTLGIAEVGRYVDSLQAGGLIALDADKRLQYRPGSEAAAAHAGTLEKVYRERPVTLIRVIYGLRDSKIRSFADAFKLRRK